MEGDDASAEAEDDVDEGADLWETLDWDQQAQEVSAAWLKDDTAERQPGPTLRRYIITAENCAVKQAANEIAKVKHDVCSI